MGSNLFVAICDVCDREKEVVNYTIPNNWEYRKNNWNEDVMVCENCLEKEHKQYVYDVKHFENSEISFLLEFLEIFNEKCPSIDARRDCELGCGVCWEDALKKELEGRK